MKTYSVKRKNKKKHKETESNQIKGEGQSWMKPDVRGGTAAEREFERT